MASITKTILLSRTDSIGDVVLTLPMAGFIKQVDPSIRVIFLGRTYTKPIVELSVFVDEFVNYDDIQKLTKQNQIAFFKERNIDFFVHVFPVKAIALLAKTVGVKYRVGTTNRVYHWFTCNKLLPLSRKNSPLHEAQLNLKLLSFLKRDTNVSLSEIPKYYGFDKLPKMDVPFGSLLDATKTNVLLHPKSKGSAKEWGLDNFSKLIEALDPNKFKVFIGGTQQDADQMAGFLTENTKAINLCGKLNLTEYILFISKCEVLVAASTGPLHIAAALNKKSIGLFSSKRPMHPGRWGPLGKHAKFVVHDPACPQCLKGDDCDCIKKITPQQIINCIE